MRNVDACEGPITFLGRVTRTWRGGANDRQSPQLDGEGSGGRQDCGEGNNNARGTNDKVNDKRNKKGNAEK